MSEELIATNIVNEKRRDLIVQEAERLMGKRRAWSEISYPLGAVLSNANGDCRVIYQFFEANTSRNWIHDAQTLTQAGQTAWIVFRKGVNNESSTIAVLPGCDNAALTSLIKVMPGMSSVELLPTAAKEIELRPAILRSISEQLLALPVRAPSDPIIVIGRHRVAIEVIRQLALLPLPVDWFGEEFRKSDPSGPLIYRQSISDLSINPGSVVVVMTDNHHHDLQLCEQALQQPELNFVGCIGSTRKATLVKEQLLTSGFHRSQLDKLHIPIGLPAINGKHPSLIAGSVVAQLLTVYDSGGDDHVTISER